MAIIYVVQGAKLKCSFGDQAGSLQVPIEHQSSINGKAQANIMDYQPLLNIKPFGKCTSRANPVVAAATAANKGRLKPMPCIPATVTPWMNGKTDTWIENYPALTNKSTCMCRWCGKIEITEDGQSGNNGGVLETDGALYSFEILEELRKRQLHNRAIAEKFRQLEGAELKQYQTAEKEYQKRALNETGKFKVEGLVYQKNHNPFFNGGKDAKIGAYGSVYPKDTLWDIAKQVYGNAELWPIIADVNNLSEDTLLQPGQKLYIPDVAIFRTDAEENVIHTPIDLGEFHNKVKTQAPMLTVLTLENQISYLCAAPPDNDEVVKKQQYLKMTASKDQNSNIKIPTTVVGNYSLGDVLSNIWSTRDQLKTIGKAERWVNPRTGQLFFKFARGTLNPNSVLRLTPSELRVTIIKTGLRGQWVVNGIFAMVDGGIVVWNTGDWGEGLNVAGKSFAKGMVAGAVGTAAMGVTATVLGMQVGVGVGLGGVLAAICTGPGVLVVVAGVLAAGYTLYYLNVWFP